MEDQNAEEVNGKIHNHAEEVENSRSPSNLTHRSGSNLGPLRTGRGTPTEMVTPSAAQDLAPDLPRKSPLPPIGSENAEGSTVSSESDVDIKFDDCTTVSKKVNRPERKRPPKVLKGYRSELFSPEKAKYEGEQMVVRGADGNSKTLISMECQTEWSWMEDVKRFEGLNEKSNRCSVLTSGHDADDDDDYSEEDDEEEELKENSSKQEVPKVKVKEADKLKTQSSTKTLGEKTPGTSLSGGSHLAQSVAPSVVPSLRDDDYGIPILQLSTDSDSSDEETPSEMQNSDEIKEAQDVIGTLPSIGPPQILQYNRESEQKEIDPGNPENLDPDFIAKLGGIFQGTCEFCGNTIKKFPSMEDQKVQPPEKRYCCDEYRQFVQFMVSHPLHEKFNVDKMIDITPHAPYGSKQARNAAKERAAQRMRERELARQQATIGTMGGGAGGPSNFYQFARQMKTINYCLSSQRCLEEGWTIRPPSPLVESDQETEVFEPQPILPPWADPQKTHRNNGLVRKFYPDGSKFIILFSDGTGNVFYPSGRVAVSIVALEEKGLYSYLVTEDVEAKGKIQAVFENTGCGTTYYPKGDIRVCLDQLGGVELDAHGAKKRKWSWKDQVQHVHAPPIQPITLAVNPQVAVRIMSQDNISLTFTATTRSVRFQVGAHLKLKAPEYLPEPEIDDDQLFRDEVRNRIHELLLKVNNLLKFPKSPKLDKLPNPPHLTARQQKTEKLRTIRRERTIAKEKKTPTPVVVVN